MTKWKKLTPNDKKSYLKAIRALGHGYPSKLSTDERSLKEGANLEPRIDSERVSWDEINDY